MNTNKAQTLELVQLAIADVDKYSKSWMSYENYDPEDKDPYFLFYVAELHDKGFTLAELVELTQMPFEDMGITLEEAELEDWLYFYNSVVALHRSLRRRTNEQAPTDNHRRA